MNYIYTFCPSGFKKTVQTLSALLFTVFLLSSGFLYSQQMDASHLMKMAHCDFAAMDVLMVKEYGFERMPVMEEADQLVYSRNSLSDDMLVITVIKTPNGCSNILSIVAGSGNDIPALRESLVKNGHVYQGLKMMGQEMDVHQYTADRISVLVTDKVTSTGAHQILLMCK